MANTQALAKLDEMEKSYMQMKQRVSSVKQKAKEAVDHTTRTIEVVAGGFVAGFAEGYVEDGEIFGVDAMLAVGIGGQAAAYFLDDDTGKHVRNLSDGALAGYFAVKGKEKATEWISKRGTKGAGTKGERGQRGMRPDEFARAFT